MAFQITRLLVSNFLSWKPIRRNLKGLVRRENIRRKRASEKKSRAAEAEEVSWDDSGGLSL